MYSLSASVVALARWLNRIALVACGLLMLALTTVVLLQVLYRYVLELPLVWSDEAARHLLVWVSLIAGGIAVAQRLNPRIELIDSLRAAPLRRVVEIIVLLLVLGFLAEFIVISFEVAKTYNAYRSLSLGLPQSVPRLALPVGACLMAINVLAQLLEKLRLTPSTRRDGA
ncbi:MAG TPA: TRAP transporter small permease [Casimicrobiaceae bacterium]|nr:TRAP transporter small permease [Casimicrobiaceae bacterium]